MDFFSAYDQGFVRVAAATVPTAIADPARNAETILTYAAELSAQGVALAVFPELGVSGYALDDLLLNSSLLDGVHHALERLVRDSATLGPVLIVGAPLPWRNRVYNCAVVIHRGRVLGVAPKSFLPNYREFYEKRHFAPGDDIRGDITVAGHRVPFGPDLLFDAVDIPGLTVHVEICEDMWVPVPPSARAALAGATVLVNLSGSPITVGRARERQRLAEAASARCVAAYVYAAAGQGESSTDLSWDGQTFVFEAGDLLGESPRFPTGPQSSVVDVDVDRLVAERRRQGSFDDNRRALESVTGGFRTVEFAVNPPRTDIGLARVVDRFPFVPDDAEKLALDCYEAYHIQVSALRQRMDAIGSPKLVIGVSGGLDSTHALIVCARAMDLAGRPRSDILAYTMPGFATSVDTRRHAEELCRGLGVSFEEIDIRPAATQMLADLGHPYSRGERGREVYDVTFENVQAGLRYDYLFRLANARGGIVVGTGDLSELALGWCTYGVGDQMSHYGVNSGVPKSLMQHLIRWVIASGEFSDQVGGVLQAVLDTEISPELVPAGPDGKVQSTQDLIGPYALHDFALFHVLRRGYPPHKIAFLAWHAWSDPQRGEWPAGYPMAERGAYDLATIRRWLTTFVQRFATQQFKRSAVPNGPKVMAGGSLSPRGDWRMPSDANARLWVADIEAHVPQG
ncbi:Glutamine-dependent NAD(+) synthetase [Austwickia sp. TVS 96-490-7B]|uniref:NAD(+) synthase n=1 Tax=Austwickia sp. TVS 96-490-7B TaxID=2830843 RepID=UPI001C564D6D|nr:NAD(+) synthase [Austwickia sp. TVS 96-490-7B]MBW3085561.1 Glutamine-dependent NAD(+) synthetase [Austwickia sp. TVS 96-490-7B]